MAKFTFLFFFLFSSSTIFCQSIDAPFSTTKMEQDLEVFKEIRLKANSGLYKYRTKEQIDSIYNWAENEIGKSKAYLDFYNIICRITDFEGSSHNDTELSKKHLKFLRNESDGYFPYPIKWIEGRWLINFKNGEIPLGSEIMEINGKPISEIIQNLYQYYPTDGQNITGKRIGMRTHFPKYYRFKYGQQKNFQVTFRRNDTGSKENVTLESVSYLEYYENFRKMHSMPMDRLYYASNFKGKPKIQLQKIRRVNWHSDHQHV